MKDQLIVETYTLSRKAEFLLNNAVDEADRESARQYVVDMGLDPEAVGLLQAEALAPEKK